MLNTRRNSVNCLLPNLLRWESFNKNLLSACDIFMITKCEQNSRDGLHGLKKCYVAIRVDAVPEKIHNWLEIPVGLL